MRRISSLCFVFLLTVLSVSTSAFAALKPWYVTAPKALAPGAVLSLTVSTNFATRQDVLVDFLDANTWYAGTRITVEAGLQVNQVVFILPETVEDPATTYLAVKVLPVDGTWEEAIEGKVLPVEWSEATPIPFH